MASPRVLWIMECVACGYMLRRWEEDPLVLTLRLLQDHEALCPSSESNRRQAGASGQP